MHKAEPDGTPIFSDWVENDDGSPGDSVVKNSPANAGDADSIPGSGKSHGERSLPGNSPQDHKRVGQGSVIQQQQNI